MTTSLYTLASVLAVVLYAIGCGIPAVLCALLAAGVYLTPDAKRAAESLLTPLRTQRVD